MVFNVAGFGVNNNNNKNNCLPARQAVVAKAKSLKVGAAISNVFRLVEQVACCVVRILASCVRAQRVWRRSSAGFIGAVSGYSTTGIGVCNYRYGTGHVTVFWDTGSIRRMSPFASLCLYSILQVLLCHTTEEAT